MVNRSNSERQICDSRVAFATENIKRKSIFDSKIFVNNHEDSISVHCSIINIANYPEWKFPFTRVLGPSAPQHHILWQRDMTRCPCHAGWPCNVPNYTHHYLTLRHIQWSHIYTDELLEIYQYSQLHPNMFLNQEFQECSWDIKLWQYNIESYNPKCYELLKVCCSHKM